MLRLIKLVAYGLFGYALYEFVRGLVHIEEQQQQQQQQQGEQAPQLEESAAAPQKKPRRRPAAALTSPAGEGKAIETLERDGGGMKHTVGRGVVH